MIKQKFKERMNEKEEGEQERRLIYSSDEGRSVSEARLSDETRQYKKDATDGQIG